jgi:hypothetical protein
LSCENNSNNVSRAAAVRTGLSAIGSKYSSTGGILLTAAGKTLTRPLAAAGRRLVERPTTAARRGVAAARRGAARSATAVLSVAESFDGPQSVENLEPALVVAGALLDMRANRAGRKLFIDGAEVPGWLRKAGDGSRKDKKRPPWRDRSLMRNRMLAAAGLSRIVRSAGASAGAGLARLSWSDKAAAAPSVQVEAEKGGGGSRLSWFFQRTSNTPVDVYQSRLTPLLNRSDTYGFGRPSFSEGAMLEVGSGRGRGKKTWHLGVSVVQTPAGRRTISHLQSLTLPQTHYYFNRHMEKQEAVGIVSGQKGFEPGYREGYVGRIGEVDSLSPTWARLKKVLIKTHIFWGDVEGKASEK